MKETAAATFSRHAVAIAFVLCLSAIVGIVAALAGDFRISASPLLLTLNALALVVPILASRELRSDLLSPAVVVVAAYFLYLVMGPAYDLATGRTAFLGRELIDLYPHGLALSLVAILSFWVGYFLTVGRRLGEFLPAPKPPKAWGKTYAAVVLIVGALGFLVWSYTQGQSLRSFLLPGIIASIQASGQSADTMLGEGGAANYLLFMIELFIPGILLSVTFGRSRLWVGFWLALATVIYASIGFRYRFVILGVALLVLLNVRRERPLRPVQMLPALLGILLLMSLVRENRSEIRAAAVGTISEVRLESISSQTLTDNLFAEARIFPTFLVVADAVPERIPYDYGLTFASVLTRAIPRELWPGKPAPSFQRIIIESYGTSAAEVSGPAYPNFGEYYIVLGIPSLILGMLFFGIGVRCLGAWFKHHRRNLWVQAAYAASIGLLPQVVGRGYLAENVNLWIYAVAPILAAGFFFRVFGRPIRRTPLAETP
jgi:hypothetical protein